MAAPALLLAASRPLYGWIGLGLLALGLLLLALALVLLALSLWRRARTSLQYSPVRFRRQLLALLIGVLVLLAGCALLGLQTLLEPWDPVRGGEPAGIVEVREGRVILTSAYDGRETDLGAPPDVKFVIVWDVLLFPEWTRPLGLGTFHRARSTRTAFVVPGEGEGPPRGDRLYDLVSGSWFPGDAKTKVTPAVSASGGRTALYFLEDGDYGATPYPGS